MKFTSNTNLRVESTAMKTVNDASIRQLVITSLRAGKSTAEITADLKARHPESMAAAKPSKHIGWYRSYLKKADKAGTVVQVATEVPAQAEVITPTGPTAETEAQRIERLAAEMAARVDAQLAAAE
jgi:hypothetical protein